MIDTNEWKLGELIGRLADQGMIVIPMQRTLVPLQITHVEDATWTWEQSKQRVLDTARELGVAVVIEEDSGV
jgi:hypothetical protein